jgi:hypothetical protein
MNEVKEKKKIGIAAISQLGFTLVGIASDISTKTKNKNFKWNEDIQEYLKGIAGTIVQSDIMADGAEQGMLLAVEIVNQLLKIYTGVEKDGFGIDDLMLISNAASQIVASIPKKTEVPPAV